MATSSIINAGMTGEAFLEAKLTMCTLSIVYEWGMENLKENFYESIVFSGLEMPEEFYDGVFGAYYDIWTDLIRCDLSEYCKQPDDEDDIISFADVIVHLHLDKVPKVFEEVSPMFLDLKTKREYHELLHWFKWTAIECAEIKSKYYFFHPVNTDKARKWAEDLIKKHGVDYLHIDDFFEFGYHYGQLDWLDRVRYYYIEFQRI